MNGHYKNGIFCVILPYHVVRRNYIVATMGYRNDYKEHFVSLAILMFLAFAYSKTTNGEIPEIKNREKTIDTLNAHQMPDILYIKFYNNIALNVRSAEPV